METNDDSFIFDSESEIDDIKIKSSEIPEYILSGILAGLYYLPPERILKTQNGWGRRIKYDSFKKIDLNWKPIEYNIRNEDNVLEKYQNIFESIEYSFISRLYRGPDEINYIGGLRMYLFKPNALYCENFKSFVENYLSDLNTLDIKGLSMSNAGGFHSFPNLFEAQNDKCHPDLLNIIKAAVEICEFHDHSVSCTNSLKTLNNKLRNFQSTKEAEGWINISKHGHWNRLHTHEGAAWSGIYYLQNKKDLQVDKPYSGNLLIKPTPHFSENQYNMSDTEIARLNYEPFVLTKDSDCSTKNNIYAECEYIEFSAIENSMLIFPSYLHHAVFPLYINKNERSNKSSQRMSFAFNINIQK